MGQFGALEIALETPDQPAVRAMLDASDAYMADLYPPQSNHLLDVEALLATTVRFCVARLDGRGVGCGALVLGDDRSAEVKRMWVDPTARGRGVGRRILMVLEQIARDENRRMLRLELGIAQPAAYRMYRDAGFSEIPPFGAYEHDPLSLFMQKSLADQPG